MVNIGVPQNHPMADSTQAGPSGLHNINIGGISLPAPTFVVMHRASSMDPNNTTSAREGQTDL